MTNMLREKGIQEVEKGKNCCYLLGDENQFSSIGYKMMMSQKMDGLVRCARIRYNGKIKMIYFTEDYQTLTMLLPTLTADNVYKVFSKVIEAFLKIRDQGFLGCENIDVEPEHIYLDAATLEPHLIYLPLVNNSDIESDARFEMIVRQNLAKTLELANALAARKESLKIDLLSESAGGLESILNIFVSHTRKRSKMPASTMHMDCTMPELPLRFVIMEDRFTIGRRKNNEGVIETSRLTGTIGRVHCTIVRRNGLYHIEDEESKFGTYVNEKKLIPHKAKLLHNGDVVKLSNVPFRVYFT